MKRSAALALTLALSGCGARDCLYDLAHRDCPVVRPVVTSFPQDDASCRSYGLAEGTHAYARCREAKAHVHRLSRDESDYSFLRNPILPDVH